MGLPQLPSKRVVHHLRFNFMAVPAGAMRSHLGDSLRVADNLARKCFRNASRSVLMKPVPHSSYLDRIPNFWSAYHASYTETYLGDSRPVHIDEIREIGDDECFDLQMLDQESPYFIANGIATHNCYQEQIMQIARDIAGFSMSEADELRQVMGKKQKEKIPRYREKFFSGAIEQGLTRKIAEEIFQFVEPFAGYGFPKGHAAAYGWISYQTAYLKANYPREYLAALMTSVRDKTDKLVEYIDEARRVGIAVLPPDVNESRTNFTVVGPEIRFGLSAIKGVGEGAVGSMIEARERGGRFVDFFDFVKRLDLRQLNRKVLEALIKCGALDSLAGNRAQKLDALDSAFDVASRDARDRESGQSSLFGTVESEHDGLRPQLRLLPAPPLLEQLAWEKETLGIFVSGHPLADVAEALARSGAIPIKGLRNRQDGEPVTIAGLLTGVRRTLTKAQQQMLVATLEDMSGSAECIVFPKDYPQLQASFVPDAIVTLKGRVRFRERRGTIPGDEAPLDLSVTVNEVKAFDRRELPTAPKTWHVDAQSRKEIDALARLLEQSPGSVPVMLHVGETVQQMPRGIAAGIYVKQSLETIFGNARVWEA
jgi:DNA polymerase-3 subunit alpha